jgi:gliding motility-associated-like protein
MLFISIFLCFFFCAPNSNAQSSRDIVVKNGDVVTITDFPATTCAYKWENSRPEIGLPSGGVGNIGTFTAKNETSAPIVATISVTPTPVPPPHYVAAGQYVSVRDALTNQETGRINVPFGVLRAKSSDGTIGYFMSNNNVYNLYKVNLITNEVISNINIPTGIYIVQFSPDGSKLYVSSRSTLTQTNSITVLNPVTDAVEGVITLPANAYYDGEFINPDGTQMILMDQSGSKVTILNLVTNSVVFEIPVNKPTGIKFSPDGNTAFITSVFSNILTVINIKTGAVRTVQLNSLIYNLLMSNDGSKMYFQSGSFGAGSVDILDTQTLTVSNVSTGVFGSLYLSPDNKTLYIFQASTSGAKVGILSLATGKMLATLPVNAQPSDPDTNFYLKSASLVVSTDGQYVYTSLTNSSYQYSLLYTYVKVISTQLNTVIDSIPNGTIPPQYPTGTCSDPFTFKITVNPPPPSISQAGSLSALKTSYGVPSPPTSFTVSGTYIVKGILVTPPKGFEVSIDNITYHDNVLAGPDGTVPPTTIYVRLKATAPVGVDMSPGDIVLTSGSATKTIAAASTEVTGVPLTITAKTINKTYGTTLTTTATTGSTDFMAVGLKNGETIGSVTLNYGAGAAATAVVNTYPNAVTPSAPIGGTFIANNYIITLVNGDLAVVPAQLTITADDKSRYYAAPNPQLTVKYSGFVNNENESQLTSMPIASTIATGTSLVGQYPITVAGAAAVNYNITYVPGILTVVAQPISVTSAFTPNGDGVNDTWEIQYIGQYPNCSIEIFSRYGEKVFYSTGYPVAWNGKRNGVNLAVGTYYYIIKLNNSLKPVTGSLTIIR